MAGRTFAGQDLPPSEGYAAFHFARKRVAAIMQPRKFLLIWGTAISIGGTLFVNNYKQKRKEKIEMNSAKNAILPILMAEKDRRLLKHMRVMKERETELMKDVDGWTVGKYYGEPIFVTQGDDYFAEPIMDETYMHTNLDLGAFYAMDSLFL